MMMKKGKNPYIYKEILSNFNKIERGYIILRFFFKQNWRKIRNFTKLDFNYAKLKFVSENSLTLEALNSQMKSFEE